MVHKEPMDSPSDRPVISANGSLTESASQYIDYFIKALVPLLPSYIKDTNQALEKIDSLKTIDFDFVATCEYRMCV